MSWAERAQQIVVDGNLLIALAVAALAGFVSFASPCVLPLVPGYLSYMSGVGGQDVEQRGDRRAGRGVAGAALFVLGFRVGCGGRCFRWCGSRVCSWPWGRPWARSPPVWSSTATWSPASPGCW